MKILVLNSGSSSQKSSLYEIGETIPHDPPESLWEGKIEWRGDAAESDIKNSRGIAKKEKIKVTSRADAVRHLLSTLWEGETSAISSPTEINAAGHRVVHGGPKYKQPILVTAEVKSEINKVSAFAPLH